jgi:hypothetical protein
MKSQVNIVATSSNGKTVFNIEVPKGQKDMTHFEMTEFITLALMLCVKSAGKDDHKVMKYIIDRLNNEFINLGAFSDAATITEQDL